MFSISGLFCYVPEKDILYNIILNYIIINWILLFRYFIWTSHKFLKYSISNYSKAFTQRLSPSSINLDCLSSLHRRHFSITKSIFLFRFALFLFACTSHHFASFHCELSSGKQSEKSKWMHQKSTNRKLSVCRQRCLAHTHTPHPHTHTHSHTHTQLASYQSCMK